MRRHFASPRCALDRHCCHWLNGRQEALPRRARYCDRLSLGHIFRSTCGTVEPVHQLPLAWRLQLLQQLSPHAASQQALLQRQKPVLYPPAASTSTPPPPPLPHASSMQPQPPSRVMHTPLL